MSACDAMIAAAVASATSGKSAHYGASRKNGCSTAARLVMQQRALAEVVQQQRRQHQAEPGEADRTLAEVAHVRVQRLAAGDDEEDRAEHGEAVQSVLLEESHRVTRIERRQHDRAAAPAR